MGLPAVVVVDSPPGPCRGPRNDPLELVVWTHVLVSWAVGNMCGVGRGAGRVAIDVRGREHGRERSRVSCCGVRVL